MQSAPTTRLRAMPAVALNALERMADPDLRVADLADILRNDPAIVSRLLSFANSASCGLKVQVSDIQQVVALLGKPSVVSIVMAIALAPPDEIPEEERRHYQKYWQDAVTMATSAERLARENTDLQADGKPTEFFTVGLLSDVGRLALLQSDVIHYGSLLDKAEAAGDFPRDAEMRLLGSTHVSTSQMLLDSWGAPPLVAAAVGHHHSTLQEIESDTECCCPSMAKALALSATIVDYLTAPENPELRETMYEFAEAGLGLSQARLDEHVEAVFDRMVETAELFTIQPTDVDAMKNRFITSLESAAVTATTQHAKAQSADELRESNEELSERLEAVTVKATRDSLTGAANRETFEEALDQCLERADKDIGVVFIDVDGFKHINDNHGHLVGDAVLQGIAATAQEKLRSNDMLARYGGDEFVVLLRGCTVTGLQRVAERLQEAVFEASFEHDGEGYKATVSVGGVIAYVDSMPQNRAELLAAADKAMYHVKTSGKNRTYIASPT